MWKSHRSGKNFLQHSTAWKPLGTGLLKERASAIYGDLKEKKLWQRTSRGQLMASGAARNSTMANYLAKLWVQGNKPWKYFPHVYFFLRKRGLGREDWQRRLHLGSEFLICLKQNRMPFWTYISKVKTNWCSNVKL